MIRVTIIALSIFYSTNSFGELSFFSNAANDYFNHLEKSNTPAVYASCKTHDGKALVVFGFDGSNGMLFELNRKDVATNLAPIIIKGASISIDTENTNGGLHTYTVMENHAKDIIKLSFTFVFPENVKNVFSLKTDYVCVDKPPEY